MTLKRIICIFGIVLTTYIYSYAQIGTECFIFSYLKYKEYKVGIIRNEQCKKKELYYYWKGLLYTEVAIQNIDSICNIDTAINKAYDSYIKFITTKVLLNDSLYFQDKDFENKFVNLLLNNIQKCKHNDRLNQIIFEEFPKLKSKMELKEEIYDKQILFLSSVFSAVYSQQYCEKYLLKKNKNIDQKYCLVYEITNDGKILISCEK